MSIKPEKVVNRYYNSMKDGKITNLKSLLNTSMVMNFNRDVPVAIVCSRILSAIDLGEVEQLDEQELSFLDKHLIHGKVL